MSSLTVYPTAKINLFLEILGKRTDGYHSIHSLFIPVTLTDSISFELADELDLQVTGLTDCSIDDNLVWKAANLLKKTYDIKIGAKIQLHKNIPSGAGLGGGSSDAAFTLKALSNIWNMNLSINDLEVLSSSLGSDCPFFVKNSPAIVTGRGDRVETIDFALKKYILIVCPNVYVSTPKAYAMLGYSVSTEEKRITCIADDAFTYRNDFENVVFEQYPQLREVKDLLYKNGAVYASMSGSGSAIFGIFDNKESAESTQNKISYTSYITTQNNIVVPN